MPGRTGRIEQYQIHAGRDGWENVFRLGRMHERAAAVTERAEVLPGQRTHSGVPSLVAQRPSSVRIKGAASSAPGTSATKYLSRELSANARAMRRAGLPTFRRVDRATRALARFLGLARLSSG